MLFDSLDFAVFLPLIFILYWFVFNRSLRFQNLLIVAASCFFYGSWNVQFLILIFFSIVVDYAVGWGLEKTEERSKRKFLLVVSLVSNLGMLLYFKYCNFFIENFTETFTFFGGEIAPNTLNIILPVGISFYTFQTLSYTIDVYRRKIQPARNIIQFSAFVSFFPQLVAGPIERASHLLPQFSVSRQFSYPEAVNGLRQMLWGLFKKIVIADNCARYANMVFDNSDRCNGSTLLLGVVFFGFQIYCDFSGYSDIAIGTSRLFGFKLSRNFAFPYFSRNIAEFWQRWHISLSTWFKDYLYIPLGGSRHGRQKSIRNLFIIFLVSGFWHGASWNFVIWGGLNAFFILPVFLSKTKGRYANIVAYNRILPSLRELSQMLFTHVLLLIAWIFFRGETLAHTFSYFAGIFDSSFFTMPYLKDENPGWVFSAILCLFVLLEWVGREGQYSLDRWIVWLAKPFRYLAYFILIFGIFYFSGVSQQFLYFQF